MAKKEQSSNKAKKEQSSNAIELVKEAMTLVGTEEGHPQAAINHLEAALIHLEAMPK